MPRKNFRVWIDKAAASYKLAVDLPDIDLLNTTIRFVVKDSESALPYSQAERRHLSRNELERLEPPTKSSLLLQTDLFFFGKDSRSG